LLVVDDRFALSWRDRTRTQIVKGTPLQRGVFLSRLFDCCAAGMNLNSLIT